MNSRTFKMIFSFSYLIKPFFSPSKRRVLLVPFLLTFLVPSLSFADAAQFAPQAWWSLSQVTMPTYASATRERNEVQQIEVTEKESFFGAPECGFQLFAGKTEVGLFNISTFAPQGTPENVQKALEGETPETASRKPELVSEGYGPGNVEVTEGTPSAVGCPTLIVKSIDGSGIGGSTELSVASLTANGIGSKAQFASVVEKARLAGEVIVRAVDVGDGPIEGATSPVVIKDALPAGLEPVAISGKAVGWISIGGISQNIERGTVSCVLKTLTCEYAENRAPFTTIEVTIKVNAGAGAESGENTVSVLGGGGPPASRSQMVTVSEEVVPFGVEAGSYDARAEAEAGLPATQAGAHPFQFTTSFAFSNTGEGTFQPAPPRDQNVDLPAGMVGDAQATARCTLAQFTTLLSPSTGEDACPAQSAIGVAVIWVAGSLNSLPIPDPVPVFNLVPGVGEPARFGIFPGGAPVVIDTSLRSGSDYGVQATVHNLTQGLGVFATTLTLWGAPGDRTHNSLRGWQCLELTNACAINAEEPQTSLLTMPSQCGSKSFLLAVNSWTDGEFLGPVESSSPLTLDGCSDEEFEPEIKLQPTSTSAYTPTGVNVHLKVPQEAGEQPQNVAEADVRNTTVTLPAGLQINPAAAAGLTGCSEQQIGYEPKRSETEHRPAFTEESEAERLGEEGHHDECPESSRIGKVTVHSNLLPEPLTGYVYQAAQNENPFKSLLALYVVAEDKKAGVRVRLAGEVKVQSDGQLISSFLNTPQVPFEEFALEFFGGGKAPLATSGCGEYRTTTSIEPWSSGAPGEVLAQPFSYFDVANGPGDSSCSSVGGFAPGFTAGTTNNDAGAFSPFVLTLSRKDGEQSLGTVSTTLPAGLLAMISNIQQCGEAQASAGMCPAASKIGHVRVSAGVGNEPIVLPEAGKPEDPVYLTGSYKGAPFGLSIVVPAEAGPFNLDENGKPVVVRAALNVNPYTAQATVQSDPMPTELHNIRLDVRSVEVVIDGAGKSFTFNPTNCQSMSIAGTIGSSEGASAGVSSHYEAANCAALAFHPSFTASTQGSTSKAGGASLTVKVVPAAGQANIAKVDLQLPKQLPARLTTLQKACTEAQFNTNPAGCPEGSNIGTATVHTPVLSNPLTGPAILVSHGGAAFPDVEFVLQGEGVKLILDGGTQIKNGITYSKFETIPDAPVSSFETILPEGPHSALGTDIPVSAKYNLCGQSLTMPTTITGQNGVVINQTTKIAVTGCPKALKKALTRAQKLKAALKKCRTKDKGKSKAKRRKRAVCEQVARREFGPTKKAKNERKGGKKK
jgi:hypothetical protein